MNRKEFDESVERMRASKQFDVLKVEHEERADIIEFKMKYFDRMELGNVTRHLEMRRMFVSPEMGKEIPSLKATFDGKVVFLELETCSKCGQETSRKNVTNKMGALLLGTEIIWGD